MINLKEHIQAAVIRAATFYQRMDPGHNLVGTKFPVEAAPIPPIDFLIRPDFVHKLLTFLLKIIRWCFPKLCSWADQVEGGYIYRHGSNWMPPGTIGHLANDTAMLCSTDVYNGFGFRMENE